LEERRQETVQLPPLENKLLRAWVLSTGQLLQVSQNDTSITVEVPQKFVDVGVTVLTVELDSLPKVK
jgi:hypothetical protein